MKVFVKIEEKEKAPEIISKSFMFIDIYLLQLSVDSVKVVDAGFAK